MPGMGGCRFLHIACLLLERFRTRSPLSNGVGGRKAGLRDRQEDRRARRLPCPGPPIGACAGTTDVKTPPGGGHPLLLLRLSTRVAVVAATWLVYRGWHILLPRGAWILEKYLAHEEGRSSRSVHNRNEYAYQRSHMLQEWAEMVLSWIDGRTHAQTLMPENVSVPVLSAALRARSRLVLAFGHAIGVLAVHHCCKKNTLGDLFLSSLNQSGTGVARGQIRHGRAGLLHVGAGHAGVVCWRDGRGLGL
jgi:hypothetical protein